MSLDYPGYLILAANRMAGLLMDGGDPNSFRKAAEVGCATLQLLARDAQFFHSIQRINDQTTPAVVMDIFEGRSQLAAFLDCEAQLFSKANLHPGVVVLLKMQVQTLVAAKPTTAHAIQIRETISSRNMHRSVEAFRDQACELSRLAVEAAQKDVLKQLFVNLVVGMGSIASAALNASPLAQQLMLDASISQLSTLLGSALLGETISNIHENLQTIKSVNSLTNSNQYLRR